MLRFTAFAATFRDVTQRSPERNGCSYLPHSFLDSGGALRDTPKDGWEGHYLPRDNLEKKSKPACRELINWTRVKHYAFCFNPCL